MRFRTTLVFVAFALFAGNASTARDPLPLPAMAAGPRVEGTLSVLTYNVKGGPWPVAWNRSEDLAAIGTRLAAMRAAGNQPHVVVLQEAFSSDAKAIARAGGYRFVVDGPGADVRNPAAPASGDAGFLVAARWWVGERSGKALDSGLLLLSDYPVRNVRRTAFPDAACAGLDCMANKGALMVTLDMPGAPSPVDVVTTHLNSRRSSGVSDARSLAAYRRQAGLLADFIRRWHDPRNSLIAAGDFNVGKAPSRWQALRGALARWTGASVDNAVGAVVRAMAASRQRVPGPVEAVIRRNTDWQFFASGSRARIAPVALSVPFGLEQDGGMLSDHIGYTASFRLLPGR